MLISAFLKLIPVIPVAVEFGDIANGIIASIFEPSEGISIVTELNVFGDTDPEALLFDRTFIPPLNTP